MEVIVEYDYAAEEPDELTIQKGDIIKDVSPFEEGWYIGNLKGKIGVFPDNFVKIIRQAETPKELEVGTSQKQSVEKQEEAVDTSDGRPKRVLGIGLGNIFSGKPIELKQSTINEAKKETGQSPEDSNDITKAGSTKSPVLTDRVRAKFEYQPKQPDELELQVDDVIQILDRSLPDEGWWSGKNLRTRKIGVFPDNFVVPLTEHNDVGQTYKFQNLSNTAASVSKQNTLTTSTLQNGTNTTAVHSNRVTAGTPNSYSLTTAPAAPEGRVNEETKVDWRQSISANHPTHRTPLPDSKPGITGTNMLPTRDASRILAESVADIAMSPINANSAVGVSGASITAGSALKNAPSPSVKPYVNADRSDTLERQKLHRGPSNTVSAGDTSPLNEELDESNSRIPGHMTDRPKQAGRRLPSKFTRCANATSDTPNTMPIDSELDFQEEHTSGIQTNQPPRGLPTPTELLSSAADLTENSRSLVTQKTADHSSKPQRGILSSAQARSITVGGRNDAQVGPTDTMRPTESNVVRQTSADGQKQLLPKLQAQLERLQAQYDQYVAESKQQMKEMRQQIEQLKNTNTQLRIDMSHGQKALTERIQSLMTEVDEAKKQQASDMVEHSRLRKIIMRLDAKAIMSPVENNTHGNDTPKGTRKHHHHHLHSGGNTEEQDTLVHGNNLRSLNEHDGGDHLREDNYVGTPLTKTADVDSPNVPQQPTNKQTARLSHPPPLKARPTSITTRSKS